MNFNMMRNALTKYYQDSPGKKTATDRVYIALMLRADADGIAWPTMATLAEDTNVNIRHVKEALVKLICRYLILPVAVPNPKKKNSVLTGWRILSEANDPEFVVQPPTAEPEVVPAPVVQEEVKQTPVVQVKPSVDPEADFNALMLGEATEVDGDDDAEIKAAEARLALAKAKRDGFVLVKSAEPKPTPPQFHTTPESRLEMLNKIRADFQTPELRDYFYSRQHIEKIGRVLGRMQEGDAEWMAELDRIYAVLRAWREEGFVPNPPPLAEEPAMSPEAQFDFMKAFGV